MRGAPYFARPSWENVPAQNWEADRVLPLGESLKSSFLRSQALALFCGQGHDIRKRPWTRCPVESSVTPTNRTMRAHVCVHSKPTKHSVCVCVCVCAYWLIHHQRGPGCFYLLIFRNNVAINIHIHVSVFSSFGYTPRSRTAGSYGDSTFTSLGSHRACGVLCK